MLCMYIFGRVCFRFYLKEEQRIGLNFKGEGRGLKKFLAIYKSGMAACQLVEWQGFPKLTKFVAISQRYHQPILTLRAGCIGVMAKIGYSVQELVAKLKDTIANG